MKRLVSLILCIAMLSSGMAFAEQGIGGILNGLGDALTDGFDELLEDIGEILEELGVQMEESIEKFGKKVTELYDELIDELEIYGDSTPEKVIGIALDLLTEYGISIGLSEEEVAKLDELLHVYMNRDETDLMSIVYAIIGIFSEEAQIKVQEAVDKVMAIYTLITDYADNDGKHSNNELNVESIFDSIGQLFGW